MSVGQIFFIIASLLVLIATWLLFLYMENFNEKIKLDNIKEFISGAKQFAKELDGSKAESISSNAELGWYVANTMFMLPRPAHSKRVYITVYHPITDVPLVSFKFINTVPRPIKEIKTSSGYEYKVVITDKPVPFISVILVP